MIGTLLAKFKDGNDTRSRDNIRRKICDYCQKTGHIRSQCHRLKTCNKCQRKGHIAKFCRESKEYSCDRAGASKTSLKSASGKAQIDTNESQVKLQPVSRITRHVDVGGREIDMLYDPGSTYSMITRETYESLQVRPPIVPVTNTGVGVSGGTFQLDGVVYLNFKFNGTDGSNFTMEYQPILVSS